MNIYLTGYRLKMIWIDTLSISAQMIYFIAIWYRTNKPKIRNPMSIMLFVMPIETPIPVRHDLAYPNTAPIFSAF